MSMHKLRVKRILTRYIRKGYVKGMTLMELTISIGIMTILITIIGSFTANTYYQHTKQKEVMENDEAVLYLTQVFNTIDQQPEVRIRTDNKALKVSNPDVSPTTETVYYQHENSIYRDDYQNSGLKNTVPLAQNYSVSFYLDNDASYLKQILRIEITDIYGKVSTRKISLRDCEVVGTY